MARKRMFLLYDANSYFNFRASVAPHKARWSPQKVTNKKETKNKRKNTKIIFKGSQSLQNHAS